MPDGTSTKQCVVAADLKTENTKRSMRDLKFPTLRMEKVERMAVALPVKHVVPKSFTCFRFRFRQQRCVSQQNFQDSHRFSCQLVTSLGGMACLNEKPTVGKAPKTSQDPKDIIYDFRGTSPQLGKVHTFALRSLIKGGHRQ